LRVEGSTETPEVKRTCSRSTAQTESTIRAEQSGISTQDNVSSCGILKRMRWGGKPEQANEAIEKPTQPAGKDVPNGAHGRRKTRMRGPVRWRGSTWVYQLTSQ
jgi:hypothetical protein